MSDQAPSINLHFDDYAEGHILMHDVKIPVNASHVHTYYCALQWNAGQEGGGYCGIQDSPYGHDSIFSLWDSPSTHSPITAKYTGHGTSSSRFGGEGNGLRTINYSYGWTQDRWYTLVVRNWTYGNHTRFGFWIHDQSARRWFHHATLEYPVRDVKFQGSTNCFIEDWTRDGQYSRSVYYNNGYKYSTSNQWIPFKTGHFDVHGGSRHANSYDVRTAGSAVWLATGGNVQPTVQKHGTIHLDSTPPQPNVAPISFSITSATHNHASWSVPASSTPQFSYNVKIDGQSVAYGYDSEVRSVNFNHPGGSSIEVVLEDILGRQVSHTHYISRM